MLTGLEWDQSNCIALPRGSGSISIMTRDITMISWVSISVHASPCDAVKSS